MDVRRARWAAVAAAALIANVAVACGRVVRHGPADAAFAVAMVPHHEAGIALDEIALARTDDVRVRRLAFEMSAYQGPELDQLRRWATAWAGPATHGTHGRHGSGRSPGSDGSPGADGAEAPAALDSHTAPPGMPTSSDLDSLRGASGPPFDARFLELMIAHHEGALAMAAAEEANGVNREALAIAGRIDVVQRRQLAEMRTLLAELASDRTAGGTRAGSTPSER